MPHFDRAPLAGDRGILAIASAQPTVLIVPGLGNSPEDHWQSAWERGRTDCLRADLGDWDDPAPAQWSTRLDAIIKAIPGFVVIAAHSLGCIATALWARTHAQNHRIVGALLVAPCDPEAVRAPDALRRFAPVPRARFAFPTTVVASANDRYASLTRSREIASSWGSKFVDIGEAGHINAQSNLGPWLHGQELLDALLHRHQSGVRS